MVLELSALPPFQRFLAVVAICGFVIAFVWGITWFMNAIYKSNKAALEDSVLSQKHQACPLLAHRGVLLFIRVNIILTWLIATAMIVAVIWKALH